MNWSRRSYFRRQRMLRGYTMALAMFSVSFSLVPIAYGYHDVTRLPMYMVGLLFWVSFVLTVVMALKINSSRRRSPVFNSKYQGRKKLALIHFCQNRNACIVDVSMFATLTAFVIGRFQNWDMTIMFLLVSMFVFSFGMHCMLNGINYIYINYKTTVGRG